MVTCAMCMRVRVLIGTLIMIADKKLVASVVGTH